ncbi:uncharacterized protein ARMOST_10573 [Armillaria ostoyae]|uniref:Chromo domain-containing protein n=1 Tax=Armillaria ostoyae TaxID=47428 RepID=A0A284REN9_ARMOS|nr:uncharacterized protein ARMOST_10573 [Armillaria ostoyae]
MKTIHDETRAALQKVAEQMKLQYDRKKKVAIKYQIWDKVWLDTTNLHLTHPKKKLNDKCKIYPVFNETLLTKYTTPVFSNQQKKPPLPPDIIDNEEEYKVEPILDHKTCKVYAGKEKPANMITNYLIKWKGYGMEEHKWTKESELSHAKEAIADYLKSRENTITVQAVVVQPGSTTFILDSQKKGSNIQFQVQQGRDFPITQWYFKHKIPHLKQLISNYYLASREEFGFAYGPLDGFAPEEEGG